MIQDTRITKHCEGDRNGKYVVYWMQQSQRTNYNYALEFAIERANLIRKPLLVVFGLTADYPEANERHYKFMLEGLVDVNRNLAKRNIGFEVLKGCPDEAIKSVIPDASELIMDKGYMKIQKVWRNNIKEWIKDKYPMDVFEVEGDVVVPIHIASGNLEYAARTIRPKITKKLDEYLLTLSKRDIDIKWNTKIEAEKYDLNNIEKLLQNLPLDRSVKGSNYYIGGEEKAHEVLNVFLNEKLKHYDVRNHPEYDYCSDMSPYLHFGQISVVEIAIRAKRIAIDKAISSESIESFLEEIIVRRELAMNYVYYNEDYDKFEGMTDNWAYETMKIHESDEREFVYSFEDLEEFKTHDKYWNAAMKEMVITGKMHTYMRMYWCKKIIEWTKDYKTAYDYAIGLNNKYFIDGRDANSYTGVAWCFGKHDHGWKEREIFGKLRYMNANGLKRKFDIEKYVNKIDRLGEF